MTFDPLADVIDLRDVCDEVEADEGDAHGAYLFMRAVDEQLGLHNVQESDAEILRAVRDLAEDEPTIIADRYFVEYAQELAEDIGAYDLPNGHRPAWPYTCIDWEWAARELQHDYSSFTYDGRTYWIRAT